MHLTDLYKRRKNKKLSGELRRQETVDTPIRTDHCKNINLAILPGFIAFALDIMAEDEEASSFTISSSIYYSLADMFDILQSG
jgi:hypothetical protein